jgi:hypothetical protein
LQKHDFLRAGSGRALGRTCGSHHAWSPRYWASLTGTAFVVRTAFQVQSERRTSRSDDQLGRPAGRATAPSCGGHQVGIPAPVVPDGLS